MKLKKTLALGLVAAMAASFTACGSTAAESAADSTASGEAAAEAAADAPDGDGDPTTLTVAMECAYAPYNWTQSDDSNGAVAIRGSSDYAYGYDVMMAKKIADALGQNVQIVKLDWDSLIPAVMSGDVDCVIAGQSITAPGAGLGRRKEAVARVRLVPGSGKWTINGRTLEDYFPNKLHQQLVKSPFVLLDIDGRFDVIARINGGGVSGQAGALRLGVSRALNEIDRDANRPALKKAGFLTRDARATERKKAGLKKARKASQFSKR